MVYSRPLPSDTLGLTHDAEGHITTSILEEVGAPKSADFYVCGPTGFIESISRELACWSGKQSFPISDKVGDAQRGGVKNAHAVVLALPTFAFRRQLRGERRKLFG